MLKIIKEIYFYMLGFIDKILYRKKKIYIGRKVKFKHAKFQGQNKIYRNAEIINSKIGFGTYVGPYSKLNNTLIGKYCSLGPNIEIILGKHPLYPFVSTHPIFYSIQKQNGTTYVEKSKFEEYRFTKNNYNLEIGNDVWIGSGVKIFQGLSIGDGSVLAAGAMVTQNIPPYEIWGGIPAKKIKDRFLEEQKKELLRIKWWDFKEEELEKISEEFQNIELFLKKREKNEKKS